MINLTAEEREKFSAYLEQEAKSNLAVIEQMEKLSNPPQAAIDRYRHEGLACKIVARMLCGFEEGGF
jgi:hypothetical protein